jgi:hypothetical protein
MSLALLATLAMLGAPQGQTPAPQLEPVAALVQSLERAAASGDREAIRALGMELDSTVDLSIALTTPPPSRLVIRERDRTPREGGLRLLLEVFWERGLEGRLGTWSVDIAEAEDAWRIVSASRLSHVTGLYRLSINRSKQFDVRNLKVEAPDLQLTLPEGAAFVAETPDGVTGVVLLGDGEMTFAPPDLAERTQVRIFSGSEVLATPFDAVFLRLRPEEFELRLPGGMLIPRESSEADLRQAEEVFDDYIGRSLQINLDDLSRERWSITPQPGDFIAEIQTRRFGVLTYTRSNNDAEDVTLFDRRRRRNISVYASADKLASRGRFYSEDDLVDYDVLAHDIEVTMIPDRETIRGNARLKLKVRSGGLSTVHLRLAEELHVSGVYSPAFGRVLHLRVVNQNALIVNLPRPAEQDAEFWLNILYYGKLPSQELEREAIAVTQDAQEPVVQVPAEPRYLYSNRSYWYPQSVVTDYATVRMKVTVPAAYDVLATGLPVGEPAPPPGVADPEGPRMRRFVFESDQPVRYLACVITRLRDVDSRRIASDTSPEGVMLYTRANPRQSNRARNMAEPASEIFRYYASLVGDVPYPSLTLAFTERDVPGGHSPAYFAVVDQPIQAGLSWRNDPVNFDNYPTFFIAHEIAHQWWGQAIGWKNYHEQWLSEGFSQYFAVLYAERYLPAGVHANVLRRMRQTAMRESDQGPIYLGYRLGHIKGDARVFRSIAYNKAAMVLHMLRRLIGDEAFFTGVRRFFAEWKFRKAGTSDLIEVMEQVSGRDLSTFFEGWIFGATIPQARFSYKADATRAVLRVEQPGVPMQFPVTVRLTYTSGREEDVVVVASGKVSERVIALTEPIRSARANPEHGSLVNLR